MRIRVRYFASIRETLGVSEEWLDLPENVHTVGDLRQYLVRRGTVWAAVLAEENGVRMAFELKMATAGTVLTENGEAAFFPPVTGG